MLTDFLAWLREGRCHRIHPPTLLDGDLDGLHTEGRQAFVPQGVLQGYEQAFRDQLSQLIRRTRDPKLRAKFVGMLDCPVTDGTGHCRSFTDYIVSALIRHGVHRAYDIEAAIGYVVEKMLVPTSEAGGPRATLFGGF